MLYENIRATKFKSKTDYANASVLIEKKDITLNYNSYTKRTKIFNDKGIWVDTQPLNIYKNNYF